MRVNTARETNQIRFAFFDGAIDRGEHFVRERHRSSKAMYAALRYARTAE